MAKTKKSRVSKKKTIKQKTWHKGKTKGYLVASEAIKNIFLDGMTPIARVQALVGIIKSLPENSQKSIFRSLGASYGITPEIRKKLKRLERLEKILTRN